MNPTQPTQLDPQALAMTKAIRQVESGGNFQAQGKSGEYGAYQFTKDTWNALAPKYGVTSKFGEATPEDQNKVAYNQVADWKNKGFNVGQVASMWNAGSGKPNAYLEGNAGTNSAGVNYDTQGYAQKVAQAYQQFKPQQTGGVPGIPTANAQVPGQQPQPQQDQGPSVSGFIGNAASSAGNLVGGLGQAVMHPIKTAETLAGTVAGGFEKLGGLNNSDTQMFDNTIHYLGQRYGGSSIGEVVKNIGHTLYTDPVGAALDLSTVLDGAGAAIGAAGKIADISKVAELSKAADYISSVNGLIKTGTPEANALLRQEGTLTHIGDALTAIGKYTNPLGAVAGIGKKAIGLAGKLGGETLGVSTGAGYGAIKGAFNAAATPGSQAAFRAGISGGEDTANTLVDSAQQAFRDLKNQRGNEYQSALSDIKSGTHTLDPKTFAPVADTFDNLLHKFDITRNPEGELNFSNSRIRNENVSVGDIQDIDNEIKKYTTGQKQITPVNIDDLKQFIDERYSAGSRGSAFTMPLGETVRKVLKNNVPGYESMTSNYAKASNDLKDFRQSLSVGGKASRETILKKLTSTLRANNEYRQTLLKEFSVGAGKDVFSQAAGASMQSWIPLGLSKYAEGLAAFINPHILMALPFSSPRLVGEFVNALGKGNAALTRIGDALIRYKAPLAVKAAIISNHQPEKKQEKVIK